MSTIIESIERSQLRKVPRFAAGDRVRVHFQVIEGTRKRTQVFEGIVIARQGSGVRETFTVRKQSFGVGVERIFPVHSPKIEQLEVVARGAVRRAKLYYLRGRVGKRARVAERRWGIADDLVIAEEPEPDPEPEPEAELGPGTDETGEELAAEQESEAEKSSAEVPEAEQPPATEAPEAEPDADPDAPSSEAEEAADAGGRSPGSE